MPPDRSSRSLGGVRLTVLFALSLPACGLEEPAPPGAAPTGLRLAFPAADRAPLPRGGGEPPGKGPGQPARARNVILFVGDGMGISTISALRAFAVGVEGELVLDRMPYTALSRTADADHIVAESASTMSAIMTGHKANSGVLGFARDTEHRDFNQDGDGPTVPTLLEQAIAAGMRTGVVSTARVTHATPAACYAHIHDRDQEAAIALQALPGDPSYNAALGPGVDLLLGGGRQFFLPATAVDEEGDAGSRTDGRDLRAEFQEAGYAYAWNAPQLAGAAPGDLPLIGLFERGHMEYEVDRAADAGGEPSLSDMTARAIELLAGARPRARGRGYFLMIEGGRIDHAHHAGNAWRALHEAAELDRAVGRALSLVDLEDTLVLVTADHSHVFTMAGYPLRPVDELGYPLVEAPAGYLSSQHGNLFDVVYDVNGDGVVSASVDADGVPYTVLGYHNGPGHRGQPRVDPAVDPFPGLFGQPGAGPAGAAYRQEAAVPLGAETHGGEDVALFAIGVGAERVHGTMPNTRIHHIMAEALGL